MRCGLYGKLPVKRDYVALSSPRPFLNAWEPWIQSAVSASRQGLATEWQKAYLTAPIWRFWLGRELCGTTVIGALMPSLDGLGRYFPLTLFAPADEGAAIPPPEFDPQEQWFAAVEELLLKALDHDFTFDNVTDALDQMPLPACEPSETPPEEATPVPNGFAAKIGDRPVADVFAAMRRHGHARNYSAMTYWWTAGGEGYDPMAISCLRMPDPFLYTEMLTGRFAFAFD